MSIDTCPTPRGHRLTSDGPRPRSCGRLACGYCGPRQALSTAIAIQRSAPVGSGVVTLPDPPPDDLPRLRAFATVLGRVAADLRGAGHDWEYVWVVELSPTGLPHVHVLQCGSRIQSRDFRRALARHGGRGNLQPARNVRILARYVLKLPLAGLDRSEIDAEAAMELHLRLNGSKLVHASRNFWTDPSGRSLPGVRTARASARSAPRGRRRTDAELRSWRGAWGLPPGLEGPNA